MILSLQVTFFPSQFLSTKLWFLAKGNSFLFLNSNVNIILVNQSSTHHRSSSRFSWEQCKFMDPWVFEFLLGVFTHKIIVVHQAGAYPIFCSMKQLGVFVLPPGWDASPSQGYPSIKFAGTHLYTWVKRGTVRVKSLAQEHNAVPLPGRQNLTAWSRTLKIRAPHLPSLHIR